MIKWLLLILLLCGTLYSESYFLGYELVELGENATEDMWLLGLGSRGLIPNCTSIIAFLSSMPASGSMIEHNDLNALFSGNISYPTICIFKNYTCVLNNTNRTYASEKTIYGSMIANFTNVQTMEMYSLTCRIYQADGTYSTTEERLYSILGMIISAGEINMMGIMVFLGMFGGILWLAAAFLYQKNKPVFAYPFYILGIIVFMWAVTTAMEDAALSEGVQTAWSLQWLLIGLEWLLIVSIGGAILYLFLAAVVQIGKFVHIKLLDDLTKGKL